MTMNILQLQDVIIVNFQYRFLRDQAGSVRWLFGVVDRGIV